MPDQSVLNEQTVTVESFAVKPDQMAARVADAYRDAALSGLNMRRAVDGLEAFRSSVTNAHNCFDVFDTIDEQIGLSADDDRFVAVLETMRRGYMQEVLSSVVSEVTQSLSRDRDAGVRQFRAALAGALGRWRNRFAMKIALIQLPEPAIDRVLARMDEWRTYLLQDRLQYCDEFLVYLSESPGPDRFARSDLLAAAAAYQLAADDNGNYASELLKRAAGWSRENPELFSTYGQYWLQLKDKDQARAAFERGLRINTKLASGLCGLGDLLKLDSNYLGAEDYYQQAIRAQPGYVTGYMSLVELYGRPELFNDRVDRIPLLTKRAASVEPDGSAGMYIAAGTAFQTNGHYQEAYEYFRRAVEADPRGIDGHIAAAHAYLEESKYQEAENSLRAAAEIAPHLPDLHWEFGMLYEEQMRWGEALQAYERAIATPSPWRLILTSRAAEMKWKLENRREAEDDLLRELEQHPDNTTLLEKLHDFATQHYEELNEPDMARSLLAQIRKIKGANYESNYQNRIGNIHYYHSEFVEAAECYLRASRANPNEPLYHSNLGLAHQGSKRFEDARREFEDAFKIDGEKETYDRDMAGLLKAEGDAVYEQGNYGEALGLYREAAELQPSSGTYLTAIASALERLPADDRRVEHLSESIQLLRRAEKLDAASYQDRIDKLEDRRSLITLGYGDFEVEPPAVSQIVVEVGDDLVPKVDNRQDNGHFIFELIPAMRGRIESERGVRVSGVQMRGSIEIPKNAFKIIFDNVPYRLVTFQEHAEPAVLLDSIEQALLENAEVFMGIDDAEILIERWTNEGNVSAGMVERLKDADFRLGVCRILRALARDEVPLTDSAAILKTVAGFSLAPEDMPQAVRAVRLALKDRLPGNQEGGVIEYVPAALESRLLTGLHETGTAYTLDAELAHGIVTDLVALAAARGGKPALVVRTPAARPLLQRLTEGWLPQVTVLSEEELSRVDDNVSANGV